MEPHLPAVTAAPRHNPVPTTLSAVPDLDLCSCHSQSSLQLSLSSPHLPFQPILCPTKARGSTVLVSHSPAQNPSMAPLCPRLRSELLSLASLPSRSGSYPSPPALPHFPSCMLDSGSLFSQPMSYISTSGSFPELLLTPRMSPHPLHMSNPTSPPGHHST